MHKLTLIGLIFGLLNVIKCDWWENVLIYEIAPKSFKDSDGDGIGDINGITSKLDYVAELGVDAILLPGIYATSSDDIVKPHHEITDHKQLNKIFGKLDDFKNLVLKTHEKGLKILLDFVPGYTSNEHLWFLKSVQNETVYTDFYIWANPQGFDKNNKAIAPDDLEGYRYSSRWVFNEIRGQFYYSRNEITAPKLNLRNPFVIEEMKNILRFWLNIGVDGFFVQDTLRLISGQNTVETHWELQKLLHEFRELLDKYRNTDGSTRLLVATGVHFNSELSMFYNHVHNYTITHFPFDQFHLMNHYNGFVDANRIKYNIDTLLEVTPKGKTAAWASESYFRARITANWGIEYIAIAAVQTLLLPGAASMFYGQEIGLRGIENDYWQNSYIIMFFKQEFWMSSDYTSASCPMQWDATEYSGFTNSAKGPWRDVRADYWNFNVEEQKRKKDSYYNFYKELIKVRKTNTCKYGDVETYVLSEYVFAFTRSHTDSETIMAVFNFNYKTENVELKTLIVKPVKSVTVLLSSPNSIQKIGESFNVNSNGSLMIEMRPLSVVVCTTLNFTE